ncbi:MAG: Asp-tRNA(Asn)/Glu-tRNA(Gln) amidotransferase subunit GatA [Firmicutes bacterium]|nr:Asp-tRNA(Asn)/Glu-tRNA(Gln) amidotransferase subunit GatA [Bacillota bacterium]
MNLHEMTAHRLHELLKAREISSTEIVEAVFNRIEAVDGTVKAYMTLTREQAMAIAREADAAFKNGQAAPLTGIPLALKDNMCTSGIKTTCSSKILENFVPPYNATVVERFRAIHTPLVGKTNLDEFAMGSSTENSAFFTTRNPWDTTRVPGGSSGGSAAAVAADEAVIALGSDTGGSIRQPAAFCGVVGMKPTYGYVSRYGLIAFASSLDQIGPFTRDVTDTALVMNVIAGHDPLDSTSVRREAPDFTKSLVNDVKGLRIGVPREYFVEGIQPEVKEAVAKTIDLLARLGAEIQEISMPHTEYALATYYLIAPAEASSNLARYDGVRYGYRAKEAPDVITMFKKTRSEGFGAEVKRRIMLGTYALSSGYYDAYYLKAQKVRTLIKQDFDRAFETCDALVSPTTPTVPFKIGEKSGDPLAMYLSDLFTIPANLAATPALSVPCALSKEGLPIGIQVMGKAFDEGTLLRIAYTIEQNTDVHNQKPNLAGAAGRDAGGPAKDAGRAHDTGRASGKDVR